MSIGLATKIEAIKTAADQKLTDEKFGEVLAQRMGRKENYSRDAIIKWKRGKLNPGPDAFEEMNRWYGECLYLLAGQDPLTDLNQKRDDVAYAARRLSPRNLDIIHRMIDDMVFGQQLEERGLVAVPAPRNNGEEGGSSLKITPEPSPISPGSSPKKAAKSQGKKGK